LMSIFAKATAKKKEDGPKQKKQTVWAVGDGESAKISTSIHELVMLKAQEKAIKAKMGIHAKFVLNHAKSKFCESIANTGVLPDTPMKIQNQDGESVTFVVQERHQYPVKDESVDALTQLLGEDGVRDLIYDETTFSFNRDVLALDGVMPILSKHLERAVKELVKSETLSDDVAESLLDVEVKRSFRPGIIQRLGMIAGRNAVKIRQICESLGSTCVQYILP
jgi:hypothetical protein